MHTNTHLDNRLVRALHEGADALPGDLTLLRRYLQLIDRLLTEKAAEVEPNWAACCATAAEIETLQALEAAVTERAIAVEATDVAAVRAKLEIWRALAETADEGEGAGQRDRLVLSAAADLERLCRRSRA